MLCNLHPVDLDKFNRNQNVAGIMPQNLAIKYNGIVI